MSPTGKTLSILYGSFLKTKKTKKRITIVSEIIDIELGIIKKEHTLPRYSPSYLSREMLLIKKILMFKQSNLNENTKKYLKILNEDYYRYIRNSNKKF